MYTLIEDFEDDARTVTSDAFAAGDNDVDSEDDGDLLPEAVERRRQRFDGSVRVPVTWWMRRWMWNLGRTTRSACI